MRPIYGGSVGLPQVVNEVRDRWAMGTVGVATSPPDVPCTPDKARGSEVHEGWDMWGWAMQCWCGGGMWMYYGCSSGGLSSDVG
jgi:hypothetical protein